MSSREKTANDIAVVLFDLDGTLIDTADEIGDAVNDAIAPLIDNRRLENALVKSWIGNGAGTLFKLALSHCGVEEACLQQEFDARWGAFHRAYANRCGTNSQPYPGAMTCLQALQQAGYRLGVVTNKEGDFTDKVLCKHGMYDFFDIVIAGNTLTSKKPDPETLWTTFSRLGEDRKNGLFVGDSMVDVQTGAAAKVRTWAITHGYHNGAFDQPLPAALRPERFVASFDEIKALLA